VLREAQRKKEKEGRKKKKEKIPGGKERGRIPAMFLVLGGARLTR